MDLAPMVRRATVVVRLLLRGRTAAVIRGLRLREEQEGLLLLLVLLLELPPRRTTTSRRPAA